MIKMYVDIDKAREKIHDMIRKYKDDHPVLSTFDSTWNTAFDLGASNAALTLFELLNDKSAFKISYIKEEDSRDR